MNIKNFLFHKVISQFPVIKKFYTFLSLKKMRFKSWYIYAYPILKQKVLHPKTVFLVLTPEHINLGDHAIAYAENKIFKELSINYYEITGRHLWELSKRGYIHYMNGVPIFINGGGNLGTLWPMAEKLHRDIIEHNPKSSILIFPNTIYYENSSEGERDFDSSKTIYNQHKNLLLFAREKTSFYIMSSAYNNVKIAPDIVLSLNESYSRHKRSGCLICLRNDCEKTLTSEQHDILREQIICLFNDNYKIIDMYAKTDIPINRRDIALQEKFNEFKSAELVITDRLHGMIFCAITGTPCIVLNSKSHKVRGCYEWIKDFEYIQFAENINQIPKIYKSIPKKDYIYDNQKFEPMYNELKKDIVKCANKKLFTK